MPRIAPAVDDLGDLRAFAAAEAASQRAKCFMCRLPKALRLKAERGIKTAGIPCSIVARWLEKEGHPVKEQSVTRHMRLHVART